MSVNISCVMWSKLKPVNKATVCFVLQYVIPIATTKGL